jgi:hypothetical protein
MNRVELLKLIVSEEQRRTWREYGELVGEHPDKVRKWWRWFKGEGRDRGMWMPGVPIGSPIGDGGEEFRELSGTTYKYEEDGTFSIDTYYDHPPTPEEVMLDHKIDGKEWTLKSYYSKAKPKGWHVTALFGKTLALDGRGLSDEDIERVVRQHLKTAPVKIQVTPKLGNLVLRLVYTDTHIGLDPDKNGKSLYGGKWDREELYKRGHKMIQEVVEVCKRYPEICEVHIVELGDYLDGWDATTTRKSHHLPQNMTNGDCFDLGVSFKLFLIDGIHHNTGLPIECHSVTDDNHSGDFAYVVNSAVKQIAELKYGGAVRYHVHTRFMSHYFINDMAFVLSHGKDAEDMKTGFPVKLDKVTEGKIQEYMKHHGLYGKNILVTFEKGDSHQQLLDEDTSSDFDYYNYRALSPASSWVQKNFKKSRSGFSTMVVDPVRKTKTTTAHTFPWG